MAIHARCVYCGQALSAPDEMRGKWMKCPHCGEKIKILDEKERKELEAKAERERIEERAKIAEARRRRFWVSVWARVTTTRCAL